MCVRRGIHVCTCCIPAVRYQRLLEKILLLFWINYNNMGIASIFNNLGQNTSGKHTNGQNGLRVLRTRNQKYH